jgi:hypothetical protein
MKHGNLLCLLLFSLMLLFAGDAFAGGSTTYYYKASASVGTGKGKVYVSGNSTKPTDDQYKSPAVTTDKWSVKDLSTSTVYLYAKPETGYKFNNWTLDGTQVSTSAECSVTIDGSESKSATATAYKANFVEEGTKLDGFRDGFYRVRNAKTGNYICIVNDKAVDYQTIIAEAGGASASLGKMDQVFKSLSDNYIAKDINLRTDEGFTDISNVVYLQQNATKYNVGNQGTTLSALATGKYYGDRSGDITFTDVYAIFTPVDNHNEKYQISINPTITAKRFGRTINNYTAYFCDNNGTFGLDLSKPAASATEYQWKFEPVDYFCVKPLSDAVKDADGNYWTTLTTAFPYTIPADGGVQGAYTVKETTTDNGSTYAQLSPLAGQGETMPAGTPVLLKLSSADPAENKLVPTGIPAVGNSSKKVSSNLLSGVYLNGKEENQDNYRVLNVSSKTQKIGFFKMNSTKVKYMGGNKAFLDLSQSAASGSKGAVYIDFDHTGSGTTGIADIHTDSDTDPVAVYDLQGRRVAHPAKGVYIVNGKKVWINK